MLKRIRTTFTAVLVLGFLSFCLMLQTEYIKNFVKEQIKQKIEAETGCIITISDLKLSPAFKMYLTDTVLTSQGQDFVKIKNGSITLSPFALWEGNFHISSFSLSHLEVSQFPAKAFEVSGSLTYDPAKSFVLSSLEIDEENHSDAKLTANLIYHEGQGTLSISKQNCFGCEGSFNLSKEGGVGLTLHSNTLNVAGFCLDEVAVHLTAKPLGEIFQGKFSLSFNKFGQPYRTGGELACSRQSASLQTTISIAELMQLCAVDADNVEGKAVIKLEVSEKGVIAKINVIDGLIESYKLGTIATDINGILEGDLNKIEIKEFTGKDGNNGLLSISGALLLDSNQNYPYHLDCQIETGASLVYLDNIKAEGSGQLNLKGNANWAILSGNLTTQSVRIRLPKKSSDIVENLGIIHINSTKDVPVPSPKDYSHFPLTLDINVVVPGNAKLKNEKLRSEWKGEAKLQGTVEKPELYGEFKVIEGNYMFRGKSFAINQGTITFAGPPAKKTSLYVIADIEIERNKIETIVKGLVQNPVISFRSNPPMSQTEIVSWLLFNKGIREISPFQGAELHQSITQLSSGVDEGPDVLTRIGSALGLDRIDIKGSDDRSDVSLKIGKYVSKNTFLSISKNVSAEESHSSSTSSLGIETSIGKNIKIQAEVSDDSQGQVNLLWKKDY